PGGPPVRARRCRSAPAAPSAPRRRTRAPLRPVLAPRRTLPVPRTAGPTLRRSSGRGGYPQIIPTNRTERRSTGRPPAGRVLAAVSAVPLLALIGWLLA